MINREAFHGVAKGVYSGSFDDCTNYVSEMCDDFDANGIAAIDSLGECAESNRLTPVAGLNSPAKEIMAAALHLAVVEE